MFRDGYSLISHGHRIIIIYIASELVWEKYGTFTLVPSLCYFWVSFFLFWGPKPRTHLGRGFPNIFRIIGITKSKAWIVIFSNSLHMVELTNLINGEK